ncbi:MAG: hypothetical protein FWG31_09645 [Oscillospiraceae bacterium]|nr:hypothetical protein [Oscillospiraceae bacterium]
MIRGEFLELDTEYAISVKVQSSVPTTFRLQQTDAPWKELASETGTSVELTYTGEMEEDTVNGGAMGVQLQTNWDETGDFWVESIEIKDAEGALLYELTEDLIDAIEAVSARHEAFSQNPAAYETFMARTGGPAYKKDGASIKVTDRYNDWDAVDVVKRGFLQPDTVYTVFVNVHASTMQTFHLLQTDGPYMRYDQKSGTNVTLFYTGMIETHMIDEDTPGQMQGIRVQAGSYLSGDYADFWIDSVQVYEGFVPGPQSGIDYEGVEDVIVTATTFQYKNGKKPDDAKEENAIINLTKETLTLPATYSSVAYSTDGGAKWKKGTFTEAQMVKLLNKGMTLWLTDNFNENAQNGEVKGKPNGNATIIAFPKINKRAPAPKLTVNYLIGADNSGETPGDWLLTAKGGTAAVKADILIGVASGKTVDERGYGQFYPGLTNGIPVLGLEGSKPSKTVYFIRTAPSRDGDVYTAASKPKKISVSGALKAPSYKVKSKAEKTDKEGKVKKPATAVIAVKKGSHARIVGKTAPTLYGSKGTLDVLNVTENVELWTAATAKKPASAKQIITAG